MVNYGLKDKVAIITGANNPQGIGATTAFAFAREGAKVVLVYKKIFRQFDENKTDKNGADRYFKANAENTIEKASIPTTKYFIIFFSLSALLTFLLIYITSLKLKLRIKPIV